jgi:hypothetical protein
VSRHQGFDGSLAAVGDRDLDYLGVSEDRADAARYGVGRVGRP